jgi:hypothetical protein
VVKEAYERNWEDYYEVLKVAPNADREIIRAAYRKFAFKYHPDRNSAPSATDRFTAINEAHSVLSDPSRRSAYDRFFGQRSKGVDDATFSPRGPDAHRRNEETSGEETTESDDSGESPQGTWGQSRSRVQAAGDEREEETESDDSGEFFQGAWGRSRSWLQPTDDELERILPWPSWNAQRNLLLYAIPLGIVAFVIGISNPGQTRALVAMGPILVVAAIYSGIATHWMNRLADSPRAARATGGGTIVVTAIVMGLMVVYVALLVVVAVLIIRAIRSVARRVLDV